MIRQTVARCIATGIFAAVFWTASDANCQSSSPYVDIESYAQVRDPYFIFNNHFVATSIDRDYAYAETEAVTVASGVSHPGRVGPLPPDPVDPARSISVASTASAALRLSTDGVVRSSGEITVQVHDQGVMDARTFQSESSNYEGYAVFPIEVSRFGAVSDTNPWFRYSSPDFPVSFIDVRGTLTLSGTNVALSDARSPGGSLGVRVRPHINPILGPYYPAKLDAGIAVGGNETNMASVPFLARIPLSVEAPDFGSDVQHAYFRLQLSSNSNGLIQSNVTASLHYDAYVATTAPPEDMSPKTHVLVVGVDSPNSNFASIDATRIASAFMDVPGIESMNVHWLLLNASQAGNKQRLFDAINDIRTQLRPNDRFIFSNTNHGGVAKSNEPETDPAVKQEPPVYAYAPWKLEDLDGGLDTTQRDLLLITGMARATSTSDEYMLLGEKVSDNELTNQFRDPMWQEVDKVFLLGQCYGGGMFGSPGDLRDLNRIAAIAASPESEPGHYLPADPILFSQALLATLSTLRSGDATDAHQLYDALNRGLFSWANNYNKPDVFDPTRFYHLFGDVVSTADVTDKIFPATPMELATFISADYGGVPEPGGIELATLGFAGLVCVIGSRITGTIGRG